MSVEQNALDNRVLMNSRLIYENFLVEESKFIKMDNKINKFLLSTKFHETVLKLLFSEVFQFFFCTVFNF